MGYDIALHCPALVYRPDENVFSQIPFSLIESAKIDGAGEFRIFFQMILPLSKPLLATI